VANLKFQNIAMLHLASYMIFLLLTNYNINMWNTFPRAVLHYCVMSSTVILVPRTVVYVH
jgi:hypothetical protein